MNLNKNLFDLWPHQKDAITEIENAWRQGFRSVCFQCPTGSGKSRVIRTIVDNHSKSKKIIYLIVHKKNLVKQLSEELFSIGLKHGIIQSGFPYIKYRIQVASLMTIIRRKNIPEPDIIIIDEFHHCKCKSYIDLISKWSNAKILGLTATPARTDGKPLKDVCQKLIEGPSMRSLIDDGYLCDYDYYAPNYFSTEGLHIRYGEYIQKEIEVKIDKKEIIGCAVAHYKKYANNLPAIACCVSIAHSEHVAKQFQDAGYKALAIHSRMTNKSISAGIKGLRTGKIEILCQVDLLGEGVDIKGAVCLIGLRPTNSLIIYLQSIGRVLRSADGKDKAIILDHVGNWQRFGLPDDYRQWTLSGTIKKDSGVLKYKRCPDCLHPISRSARKCEYCGHLWTETAESQKRKLPKQKEGELVDVKKLKPVKQYKVYKLGDRVTIDARIKHQAEYVYIVNAKSIKQAIWCVYNKYTNKNNIGIKKVFDYSNRLVWKSA